MIGRSGSRVRSGPATPKIRSRGQTPSRGKPHRSKRPGILEASEVYVCRPQGAIACPQCGAKIHSFQSQALSVGPRIWREGVSLDADLLRIDFGVFHATAACKTCSEIVRVEVPLTSNIPGAPRILRSSGGAKEGVASSSRKPPSTGGFVEPARTKKVSEATQEGARASLKSVRGILDRYDASVANAGSADADQCLLELQTLVSDYLRFR